MCTRVRERERKRQTDRQIAGKTDQMVNGLEQQIT